MTALQIDATSQIALHSLHIGTEEDGEIEVGRPDTGDFVSLPAEGVAVIRWLQAGLTVGEAAERFHSTYGLETDVVDFVRDLSGCGFVESVNGHAISEAMPAQPPDPANGWRLLGRLPTDRVSWLLSKPAYALYGAIWVALVVLLVTQPEVRPAADRAFLDIGAVGNLALLTACGWAIVFLHELAHLVAVRARGCSATLDISHRVHILVAQTDMSSVRMLPRRQRYAPYLAGMTFDAALLVTVMLLGLATGARFFATIAFMAALSLLFQCAICLRTDLYYVMTNAFRVGNLKYDTRRWLSNVCHRALGRPAPHDFAGVSPREMVVVRAYAPLAVVGVAVLVGQFLLLGLPLLVEFIAEASSGFRESPATVAFWDSLGIVLIVALQFGLLGVAMVRERRRRAARTAREEAARMAVA